MHLAGGSVCVAILLLGLDELCAYPENSVVRAARELARRGVREAARAVTFALCLPVLAVCGIVVTILGWVRQGFVRRISRRG